MLYAPFERCRHEVGLRVGAGFGKVSLRRRGVGGALDAPKTRPGNTNKLGLGSRFAFKQSISRAAITARRKHRSQAQASVLFGVAWRGLNQRPFVALSNTRAALQRCLKPAPRCGAVGLRFFLVKLLGHNRATGAV